jgi:hypothetical protein
VQLVADDVQQNRDVDESRAPFLAVFVQC